MKALVNDAVASFDSWLPLLAKLRDVCAHPQYMNLIASSLRVERKVTLVSMIMAIITTTASPDNRLMESASSVESLHAFCLAVVTVTTASRRTLC